MEIWLRACGCPWDSSLSVLGQREGVSRLFSLTVAFTSITCIRRMASPACSSGRSLSSCKCRLPLCLDCNSCWGIVTAVGWAGGFPLQSSCPPLDRVIHAETFGSFWGAVACELSCCRGCGSA